jgi:hypothetical protein
MDNMSEAIAFGAIIYVFGAALLFFAFFVTAKNDVVRAPVSAA